ncbi:MAG: DUF3727 domain-containing protein [Jaaginema sp. PMC 1079.18]|nr:DUF3727 domain-containing protein [Jaaginema sp. PMC 1080.18]MEC4852549.1 DUF3727 domain-containing protein [Jaaginema sp. PMC 1079.18]MEC4867956.1 DUF3727 domain-containing protein [Jaaginema sp. PMC 1078.18]
MSKSSFSDRNGRSDAETVYLTDEEGRSLLCSVEQSFNIESHTYFLLLPMDAPITIIAGDTQEESSEVIWLEDDDEIKMIFDDAKAVLAEQNLTLQSSAHTLTVAGEIPQPHEDDILTLEFEHDNGEIEEDDYQCLAEFYCNQQKYEIYTPIMPLLFFARETKGGNLELLSPDQLQEIQPFLEDLLFE